MRCHIPSKRSRKPSGFTLIELLTVIAIIGILAAIIIPTVSKVRDTAKKAQCVARLRQWGAAVMLFSAEKKEFVALDLSPAKAVYRPYFNLKGMRVDDQKGEGNEVFLADEQIMTKCPNGRGSGITTTLQYNFVQPIGYGGKTVKAGKDNVDVKAYKITDAASPGKLLLIIEQGSGNALVAPNSTSDISTSLGAVRKIQTEADAIRHSGIANALFLDGHVANLTLADTDYSKSKETLDRWFTLK